MTRVNARDARERFAELLDSAQAGKTIAITKHGKTVAILAPPQIEGAKALPDMASFHKKLKLKGRPMSQTVIEARKQARY
jgi:prevent-host-death family protein